MSKILVIANSDRFLYGFKKELLASLQEKNEVVVVSPFSSCEEEIEKLCGKIIEVSVDRRGKNIFGDYRLYKKYKKIIAAEKPDKILTYTVKPNIYGGRAAEKNKVPYCACVTGLGTGFQKPLLRFILKFLYRRSLKKAKAVFFENIENLQVFTKNKLIKESQAVLVSGSGVNLGEFSFEPLPETEKTNFLFIGRVMKEKGVDEFFAAAKKAKEENLPAVFSIIGGMEENYKEILENLHEDGTVVYHGFQSDVKKFIRESHAVILPSWHEGMSNALLESAAMGRPLITTNIHGCKEAVIDGVSGFLFPKQSAEDLYQKIKAFAALDPEDKQAMGRASREYIEEHFDREKVNQKTIEILEATRTEENK